MTEADIRAGDIVLVDKPQWAVTSMPLIVEEVRAWGVIGDIYTPAGNAPYRANFNEIVAVYRKVETIQ